MLRMHAGFFCCCCESQNNILFELFITLCGYLQSRTQTICQNKNIFERNSKYKQPSSDFAFAVFSLFLLASPMSFAFKIF